MAITAKIAQAEVSAQVIDRFSDVYLEARLYQYAGTYDGSAGEDAAILASTEASSTSGYRRQVIHFSSADATNATYGDGGVGLPQRATVFAPGGTSATDMVFNHVALVWSTGNVTSIDANPATKPTAANNGTYTNLGPDAVGAKRDLTITLVVTNGGATLADYALTLTSPGRGYTNGDTITIPQATLVAAGVIDGTTQTGDLTFTVTGVSTNANADKILSVAKPSGDVTLNNGNEAVFYWNLKLFDFHK